MSRTPTLHAPHGMVCSVDHLASSAGVAALRAGGSAADAAIAANAVLTVTTPNNCGLGGDLWAVVHDGSGDPVCLDAAGRAGSGADLDRLLADGATEMPFAGDVRSVTVPGCVDGWILLHQRFGRLPLAAVLAPAVALAETGFPAAPILAATAEVVRGTPLAADLLPGGRPPRPGQRLRRPGVGRALRAIAEGGRSAFYEGEFGAGLLALGAGEYTPPDLARVQARWVTPLHRLLWGSIVWTPPAPSQGYLTILAGALAELAGPGACRPRTTLRGRTCWSRRRRQRATTETTGSSTARISVPCSPPTSSPDGRRWCTPTGPPRCPSAPRPATPCTCAPSTATAPPCR